MRTQRSLALSLREKKACLLDWKKKINSESISLIGNINLRCSFEKVIIGKMSVKGLIFGPSAKFQISIL